MMPERSNCVIALTMGDPSSIAPELTIKAWQTLRGKGPRFVWIGDAKLFAKAAPLHEVRTPEEAIAIFDDAIPVLPLSLAVRPVPGQPNSLNADAIISSIMRATQLALDGAVAAVVTNPISKSILKEAGFGFPGHTEFLAHLCKVPGSEIMMLVSPQLRVVPVTIHVSLRDALAQLDEAAIVRVGTTLIMALHHDFGIKTPRVAVAGLNPHAGEGGHMGDEDIKIVAPAIAKLRGLGADVFGPLPPDTMFTEAARLTYDAALCMYHDQALIPLKTLDVAHGVNVTLGLPIIRTSPDHGTAFDIAGRDCADERSLVEAITLASALSARRLSL